MDIKSAKRAALEGLPVVYHRPGTEPVSYSHIDAILFKPRNGKLITSLRLVDMVQGVTESSIEYVEIKED